MVEKRESAWTEEQLELGFWRRVQHSMAMEGYNLTDEQIIHVLEEDERTGRSEKVAEIYWKAKREGRSTLQALKEARANGEIPR